MSKNQNSSKSKLNDLYDNTNISIVSEYDPTNPYGPNYHMFDREMKLYYKFIRMKKFVHVDKEDKDRYIDYNFDFYSFLSGAAVAAFFGTYLINRFVFLPRIPYFGEFIKSNFVLAGGCMAGATVFLLFDYKNDQFINEYCDGFLEKYVEEAVLNGFEDYEISEDRNNTTLKSRIEMWMDK